MFDRCKIKNHIKIPPDEPYVDMPDIYSYDIGPIIPINRTIIV